jgi:hypothetical protein
MPGFRLGPPVAIELVEKITAENRGDDRDVMDNRHAAISTSFNWRKS